MWVGMKVVNMAVVLVDDLVGWWDNGKVVLLVVV